MKKKKKLKAERRFLGPIITARTRRKLLETYKAEFLKNLKEKLSEEEIEEMYLSFKNQPRNKRAYPDMSMEFFLNVVGEQEGKNEVNRQNKHLKAFIKGKMFYKHKGVSHPVLTEDDAGQSLFKFLKEKQVTEINEEE